MTIDAVPLFMRVGEGGILVPIGSDIVRAYPGAMGMGANATGGRDPAAVVYDVSLLTDTLPSGIPGEFRYAINQSGPRYITFSVTGYINLSAELEAFDPDFTIAGQTSPGGVCITGWPFKIRCSNFIMRYMRSRRGSHQGGTTEYEEEGECLYITNCQQGVVDKCSFSWGTDETVQVSSWSGRAQGITFSRSIISQGLEDPHREDEHGYAFNLSDKVSSGGAANPPEVSLYQNYFVMHNGRAPQLKGNVLVDYVNNVTYFGDSRSAPSILKGSDPPTNTKLPRANLIGNFYFPSPVDWNNDNAKWGFIWSNALVSSDPDIADRHTVYVLDNRGRARPTGTEEQWRVGSRNVGETPINPLYQKSTPWDMTVEGTYGGVPITAIDTSDALSQAESEAVALSIINNAGCSFKRDSHDTEMINALDLTNPPTSLSGSHRPNVTYPGDFPALTGGAAPVDSNGDGISDAFDAAHGFNSSGAGQVDANAPITMSEATAKGIPSEWVGYPYIEYYFEWLLSQ